MLHHGQDLLLHLREIMYECMKICVVCSRRRPYASHVRAHEVSAFNIYIYLNIYIYVCVCVCVQRTVAYLDAYGGREYMISAPEVSASKVYMRVYVCVCVCNIPWHTWMHTEAAST